MAIQISSLRVSAELDASGYVAGAGQITQAGGRIVVSADSVGAALARQDAAAGGATRGIGALSRSYVEGYGDANRALTAYANIGRALDVGAISSDRAAVMVERVAMKTGVMADASAIAAKGNSALARIVSDVNGRLTEGAVALGAHAERTRLSNLQVMELSHSVRAMADGIMAGISPVRLLAMEGGRLAQAFSSGPGGVSGTFGALRDGLGGLVTPTGLLVGSLGGLALAGVASVAFVSHMDTELGQLAETAKRAALSTDQLQGLRFLGSQNGIPAADVDSGLTSFARQANEQSRNGKGGLVDLFSANRIPLDDLKSVQTSLADIAQLVQNAGSELDRLDIARLAGLSEDWVAALERGPEAIRGSADAARQAGTLINEQLVQRAADFDKKWDAAWSRWIARGKSALLDMSTFIDGSDGNNLLRGLYNFGIARPGEVLAYGGAPLAGNDQLDNIYGGFANFNKPAANANGKPATVIPTKSDTGSNRSADDWQRAVDDAKKRTDELNAQASTVGLAADAEARLRMEIDMQSRAVETNRAAHLANTSVTTAQRIEIDRLADSYAAAQKRLEDAQEAQKKLVDATTAARGIFDDVFHGASTDLLQGKSAADTLNDALGKLADRAMSGVWDSIENNLFGPQGTAGKGSLSPVLTPIFDALGIKGPSATATMNVDAGIVNVGGAGIGLGSIGKVTSAPLANSTGSTGILYSGDHGLPGAGATSLLSSTFGGVRPSSSVADAILAAASKYSVNPSDLATEARIESRFNPLADNGIAKGLFQITKGPAWQYGLTKPFDAGMNADVGAQIWGQNNRSLSSFFGRTPAPWEDYMAHQQGLGGAEALFRHPDMNAVDALNTLPNYQRSGGALAAITGNGGTADMTSQAFLDKWKATWSTMSGTLGQSTQAATQATAGISTFGQGLGQLPPSLGQATQGIQNLVNSLGNGAPASGGSSGGGGGLFGWLGGLFGGGGGMSLFPGEAVLFADGGHVNGPGTSRSDSIPAMLSNGEFVVNAASTSRALPLLHAINENRLQHFADGGVVSMRNWQRSQQSGGGGNPIVVTPEIHIHDNAGVSKSTQTTTNGKGQPRVDIMLDKMVSDNITKTGSKTDRANRTAYNLNRRITTR